MKKTIGEKVIAFNKKLKYSGDLPDGFAVLNPFFDNPETLEVMTKFYQKFYNDNNQRKFIVGINPSRHGAGVTGVPFTDTKRLKSHNGIEMKSAHTHEISSVYLYSVIEAFGGAEKFYKEFYINSPFPLAIIQNKKGSWLNANYYDDKNLFEAVKPFMIKSLKDHISIGLDTEEIFILGKKNAVFIDKINKEEKLFGKLTVLEHPRYIQQYKSKEKEMYIDKYLIALNKIKI
ncbi:SMUG2 DNA glycosylase family protein [Halpernia sp.]|uniref:SMUG2 DNA glycosylase family protein n=1 Tax=Halpernia sp. TaxID=2782209 RepID=UPI003A946E28